MKGQIKKLISQIEYHYQCHGIHVKLYYVEMLKSLKRFVFQIMLLPGAKTSAIFKCAADVQAALQIPFFQLFKDRMRIYLAVGKQSVTEISLCKILQSAAFQNSQAEFPLALGCDLAGRVVIDDLEAMPHIMYAGATNSGKSTGLVCLILSLLCKHPASEVNLVIFDIGASSMDLFANTPHLSHPIVKDSVTGIHVIQALTSEMERRIGLDSLTLDNLPTIVCVLDEYPSFMGSIVDKQHRDSTSKSISALLRRGRKAKIHLVLATQDPKNKTMEAEMSNITARIAFRVDRYQTSIAILNCAGAENLPGDGAMLYKSAKCPDPIYIQGAYISTAEAKQLVERIKTANHDLGNKFVISETSAPAPLALPETPINVSQTDSEDDQRFAQIVLWVLGQKTISAEKIKRTFSMGNRANEIANRLQTLGLISEKHANQPRKVLPQSADEISGDVIKLMERYGTSIEAVSAIISQKNASY